MEKHKILFIKGGPGSGWKSPPDGTHVASSKDIDSQEVAHQYWADNYGGKTISLNVHFSDREKKPIPIKVRFDPKNDHAYSSDMGGKQKTGVRSFDSRRAKAMERILNVIEYPKHRSRNLHADLMFEAPVDGDQYTIVLTWRPVAKVYEFHSAHFKSINEVKYLSAHQDPKNEGPLQKSGPSTVFAELHNSTESGDSLRWLPPFLVGNGMHNESIADSWRLCKTHMDDDVVENQGTYLGKAIKPSHEHDIWAPFDSPYLSDLVEAFTHTGQAHLQSFKEALSGWLAAHGQPHKKNALPALLMPDVPVHWTPTELSAWSAYFHSKPRALWLPEDYSMLVEWLLQQYWSPQWASSMADWLSVKSTLLGQIEAGLAANPPSALLAAGVAAAMPTSIPAIVELGLPVSKVTQAMIAFARERCAQAIVDMGDQLRSGVRSVILDHQQNLILGGKPQSLEQRLFDKFAAANRDWRRIAVTEVSENAAQGVVAAREKGAKLKRIEQYKGVCAWCHKIDGRVVTVVDPAKPNKDGMNEIWAGKTNIGRSSAPKKRVDGKLYDREPDELWWIAAGAQHPHCRGRWLPFSGVDPAKYDAFMAGVKEKMAKYQAEAAAKQKALVS